MKGRRKCGQGCQWSEVWGNRSNGKASAEGAERMERLMVVDVSAEKLRAGRYLPVPGGGILHLRRTV